MIRPVICLKCGKPRGKSTNQSLCQECVKSLPQCHNCTIICGAKDWNYSEEAIPCILKESGKKIFLCGSCKEILEERGYLISDKKVKTSAEEIEILGEAPNQ